MDSIKELLTTQYDYIKQFRKVLLEYCSQLSEEEFTTHNSSFGRGSVSNLLTHIGNTYLYWIGAICMEKEMTYEDYKTISTTEGIYNHFSIVDGLMESFLQDKHIDLLTIKAYQINGAKGSATIIKIITHVFTHEFHHKGQILSLTRHLGYIPIDTDIMR